MYSILCLYMIVSTCSWNRDGYGRINLQSAISDIREMFHGFIA